MTFYQELQLNQAGSKEMIRQSKDTKEKAYHLFVYLFKIGITLLFCVAFVTIYSMVFGSDNSIVGVVVLLSVMTFRVADFGIHAPHALTSFAIIWSIMTFGPRLANAGNMFTELLVHIVCIFTMLFLGCYNVVMCNQSTLLLGYLLLYGYDVTGNAYEMRMLGMLVGGLMTGFIFYRNHKRREFKKSLHDVFADFNIKTSRTQWQICVTLAVSSVIFLSRLWNIPRGMWVAIATMSILAPFQDRIVPRVKGRIPGNIMGAVTFLLLYFLLPESMYGLIGILGGIGVGLSATYGFQAIFNSWGAISIAMTFLGVKGAMFYRIFNNAFGALYALLFYKVFLLLLDKFHIPQLEDC